MIHNLLYRGGGELSVGVIIRIHILRPCDELRRSSRQSGSEVDRPEFRVSRKSFLTDFGQGVGQGKRSEVIVFGEHIFVYTYQTV